MIPHVDLRPHRSCLYAPFSLAPPFDYQTHTDTTNRGFMRKTGFFHAGSICAVLLSERGGDSKVRLRIALNTIKNSPDSCSKVARSS